MGNGGCYLDAANSLWPDRILMNALEIHKKACTAANKAVPEFEPDTAEHLLWLLHYETEKLIQLTGNGNAKEKNAGKNVG